MSFLKRRLREQKTDECLPDDGGGRVLATKGTSKFGGIREPLYILTVLQVT